MILRETAVFRKARGEISPRGEKIALNSALSEILENPDIGNRLKGPFSEFRMHGCAEGRQIRRLVYHIRDGTLTLLSLGPRVKEKP